MYIAKAYLQMLPSSFAASSAWESISVVCRAAQLQCEVEEQATRVHKVQAQLDKAEHLLSEKDTEGAIGKASAEAAARDISALRGELKAHADAAAKVRHLLCAHAYTCP